MKKKVVVVTDFSNSAKAAVDFAREFSEKLQADLEVVHVFDIAALKLPSFYCDSNPLEWVQDTIEKYREEGERALKTLCREIGNCKQHFLEGSPKTEIVQFATENKIDFLVVGTHGHSGFKKFLLGSVAEYIVRHAHCPVLVVKQK